MPAPRRLWGFGWVGCLLLGVMYLVLLWYGNDEDPFYTVQSLAASVHPSLIDRVTLWGLGLNMMLKWTALHPVTAMGLAVAMFIHPNRYGWWRWSLLAVCATIFPWLLWCIPRNPVLWLSSLGIFSRETAVAIYDNTLAHLGSAAVVSAIVIGMTTRSWSLAGISLAVSAVLLTADALGLFLPFFDMSIEGYSMLVILIALGWGIRGRRHYRRARESAERDASPPRATVPGAGATG